MTIYLITFSYCDKKSPGVGVVGAYATEADADKILNLLTTHGDYSKVFVKVAVENVAPDSVRFDGASLTGRDGASLTGRTDGQIEGSPGRNPFPLRSPEKP